MKKSNSIVKLTVFIALLSLVGIVSADDIFVASPTGDPAIDRTNIQDAIDIAEEGDIVKFDHGEYVLGDDSDFIVVPTSELRLVGHPDGTTIIGGDVLPTVGQPGSPYLNGNNSILQSPPRGFRLINDEQRISNIEFKSFRTAVMIGFGDFAMRGGYVIEDCEFEAVMYGITAHVESNEVTSIRRNKFINNTFAYDVSGGKYHVSYNHHASPDQSSIPIDFTHHTGAIESGVSFLEEGAALITENNVFEFNVINGDGIADGYSIFSDIGGITRNNLYRNNEFTNMGNCTVCGPFEAFYTLGVVVSIGGDIVDNVFANNMLDGSEGVSFATLNFGGSIDGNLIVSNDWRSIAGIDILEPGFTNTGTYLAGATNTIVLDNVIRGNPGVLQFGTIFFSGDSNQFLLNETEGTTAAALFSFSTNGLFASENPADVAVDEFLNPIESLDSNQNFKKLQSCADILSKGKLKKIKNDDIAKSVEKFNKCVEKEVSTLERR